MVVCLKVKRFVLTKQRIKRMLFNLQGLRKPPFMIFKAIFILSDILCGSLELSQTLSVVAWSTL